MTWTNESFTIGPCFKKYFESILILHSPSTFAYRQILSTPSNFMLLRAHTPSNYPAGMLPDPSGLRRLQKICVVPYFHPTRERKSRFCFCPCSFILAPRAVCVCTGAFTISMCVNVRQGQQPWDRVYKHGHVGRLKKPLVQSQLLSDEYKPERGREVADVYSVSLLLSQQPLISPALLALYWHVRV